MSRCKNCGRHGLFLKVNIHTGLCSDCQKKLENEKSSQSIESPKPAQRSLEIPTVYIGQCKKSRIREHFDDVELMRPDSPPDFSKIDLCDDVYFSLENDVVIAKNYSQILGFVNDDELVSKIKSSFDKKRPIFSRVLGYDDETGELHVVIAFYKIENYDYDDYTMNMDDSLDDEVVEFFN